MGIRDKGIYDKIKGNNPYFEDFITRSVYHSNAIEGNTLSYAETYAIIFNDNSMKVQAKPRELYEAINLRYVMDFMLKTLDEELSLDYITKAVKCRCFYLPKFLSAALVYAPLRSVLNRCPPDI